MALLKIIKNDDESGDLLRKKCRPVEKIDERIIRLIDDMRETLAASGGVGLAAPQVGILRRVVLVDNGEEVLELINPEIIHTEGEQEELEGCLSNPGKWGITHRPAKVTVKALNRAGEEYTATGEEMTARCFCHELDHLDGVLFTDRAIHMLTDAEVEEMFAETNKKRVAKPHRRNRKKDND